MKIVAKSLFFLAFIGLVAFQATAGSLLDSGAQYQLPWIWMKVEESEFGGRFAGVPDDFAGFRLDAKGLSAILLDAPHESETALRDSSLTVPLPMPDGTFEDFRVQEAPVLMPELAARFPEIKTYRIVSLKDETVTGRFDLSPNGFHATISGGKFGTVTVLPADTQNPELYASYRGKDLTPEETREMCGTFRRDGKIEPETNSAQLSNIALGPQLRTYRIAISATWEYANAFGNGTVAGTVASIATWLNAANVYFERDAAIRMLLVNNTNTIYSADRGFTAATDPFDNESAQNQLLSQNATVLKDQVGVANYNLGHVLALSTTGGNGVASLNSVCEDREFEGGPRKGSAFSRLSVPVGNSVGVHIFTHEVGHQFGAEHTHNAGGCAGIVPENGYEAGGGSSTMAYQGNCGVNAYGPPYNIPEYFHSRSIQQITNHVINGTGAACATIVNSGNNAPTVTAPTTLNIPKQTPFILTATANDPDAGDNNNLTFAWEQFDAGGQFQNPAFSDAGDPPNTTRPIFRTFAPSRSSSRIFPSLEYILNNANDPPDPLQVPLPGQTLQRRAAEKLPQVTRTLNFRVTVRDNVGGTNDANTVLNVDGNSGPFRVTSPNTAVTYAGGSQQNVTWDVANTQNAPVSAANVKISLSTDGGNTFPLVLAASVPNNGTSAVTIPNGVATTTARIKIEAVGNIFFDISDANFTITLGGTCPAVDAISPTAVTAGQQVTITGRNFTGVSAVRFANNLTSTFVVSSDTQITATVPAGAVGGAVTIVKPGCGDTLTAAMTICPGAPVNLQIDNGTFGNSSGGGTSGNASTIYVVNRLTPASYPATLTSLTVVLPPEQSLPGTTVARAVVAPWNNGEAINDITLQSTPLTLPATRETPVNIAVPPVTITAGDFVVGYSYDVPANANIFGVATDTAVPQRRSYMSFDGNSFVRMSRNYMIRANVQVNCSSVGACALNLASTTQNVAAAGGTGTVNFTASTTDCPWTATRSASWISITSPANGTGNGSVNFSVAPNNTGAARTGSITIGGKTFTITQEVGNAPVCNYAIAPTTANLAATASAGNNFAVTAPNGCAWAATTTDAWINITAGAAGNGNGTVTYSVTANPDAAARTGRITVNGQTFTITQAGTTPNCAFAIAPGEANVPATAATGLTFNVTTANGCAWTATSPDAWITITGGTGNGNGAVTYSVAANPSATATRTGTIIAGGQAFRVIQAPATQNCAYALNPANANVGATASTGNTFAVATTAGCAWTATSNAPWITVTAGNGIGNGTTTYSVEANTGAARNGTVTVNGQTFTVNQAASNQPCTAITGGLLHWYRGEVSPDDSIGGNNGVATGSIAYIDEGRIGSSILFDGASTLTINRTVENDFSIEFWMISANAGGTSDTDWTQGAGLVANDEFGVTIGNGRVMFGVGGSTITSNAAVNDSQWHHVVATRERATGLMRLFIDGVVQTATANGGTNPLNGGAQLVFGRRAAGPFYDGLLDEIKIYGTNLRDEQVNGAFTGCGAAPRIAVNDVGIQEGDPNPNGEFVYVPFTVTLSSPAAEDVNVFYSTEDDTAIEGVDYIGTSGVLTIPAGQTSGTISVPITSDESDEPDKGFFLLLQTADGVTISDDEGYATIYDDDSSCDLELDEDVLEFSSTGGTGSVDLDGNSGCEWTASTTTPWISITSGTSGDGEGTIDFSVASNSGAARTGMIVIGGQILRIEQAAQLAPFVRIGGRVLDSNGSGIRNLTVVMTGTGGPRTARTNTFGYYFFDNVATGQTVTLTVKSRTETFVARTLAVTQDAADINILTAP